MPRMTERERLADLEARQRKVAQEIGQTRRALRGKYAAIVSELPILRRARRSRAQEAGVAQRATPHRSATDPLRVPERGDISRR